MACAAWLAARSQWPADITAPCPTMQVCLPFERARYFCAPAVHPMLLKTHTSDAGSPAFQCNLTHAAVAYLWDHQVRCDVIAGQHMC